MRCPMCGEDNPPDEPFCLNCGFNLAGEAIPSSQPQPSSTPERVTGGEEEKIRCQECGFENPKDSTFCANCGKPLKAPAVPTPVRPPTPVEKTCPSCGTVNPPTANFCLSCGTKLSPTVEVKTPSVGAREGVLILPNGASIKIIPGKTYGRADFLDVTSREDALLISREHFKITVEEKNGISTFYIEDIGSTNGTKINGEEIKGLGKRELKPGDKIRIADAIEIEFALS